MSLGHEFQYPGQLQIVPLSAAPLGPNLILSCVFNAQVQLQVPQWPQACQDPPLETGPCCDCDSLSRRSWAFLETQETVKVLWRGTNVCQEKEVQTPSAFRLYSRANGYTAVFFCVIRLTISLQAQANVSIADQASQDSGAVFGQYFTVFLCEMWL